jgi:hypothetical protein
LQISLFPFNFSFPFIFFKFSCAMPPHAMACHQIDLSKNAIGDEGGAALAECINKCDKLTYIALGGNRMTVKAARKLLRSVVGSKVRLLQLCKNKLGIPDKSEMLKLLEDLKMPPPMAHVPNRRMSLANRQGDSNWVKHSSPMDKKGRDKSKGVAVMGEGMEVEGRGVPTQQGTSHSGTPSSASAGVSVSATPSFSPGGGIRLGMNFKSSSANPSPSSQEAHQSVNDSGSAKRKGSLYGNLKRLLSGRASKKDKGKADVALTGEDGSRSPQTGDTADTSDPLSPQDYASLSAEDEEGDEEEEEEEEEEDIFSAPSSPDRRRNSFISFTPDMLRQKAEKGNLQIAPDFDLIL